ncbi:sensor domain-containing diguanylate cyclase [Salimicrobium halophilum]|uniref:Diguanylate cyclase (GGDEF) domain-containing protein n=1 Tax=Salimicrobium halophilum TaxID=86666 RepID=A0A1G8S867_9BACI|nr:sensor domain-containing diguanylate cyclase [Salimicrobium halophilum]SDJ25373.1 diguanylate cyclase (GGDEF) domain-containing protein [Salimicrobium halophilum]
MKRLLRKVKNLLFFLRDWKLVRKSEDHQKQKLFELIESSRDVMYYYQVKPEKKFTYISPSLDYFLGEGYVKGAYKDPLHPFRFIHPEDEEVLADKVYGKADYDKVLVQRWKDENGVYRWFEEYACPIYLDGVMIEIAGVMRNIDDKVEMQQALEYRATHDPLTGLYNREFFEEKMELYEKKEEVEAGVLLFDLDELKHMNDTHGHKEGDRLIKQMSQLLEGIFSEDTIARIGGDEFVVLMEGKDQNYIEEKCEVLVEEAGELSFSVGHSGPLSSIGNMEKMLKEADHRMYEEKNCKKDAAVR